MNSDRKTSRKRGVKMAMQVAAISGGVAATVAAMSASEASASDAPNTAEPQNASPETSELGPVDELRIKGGQGLSCISRGPAAPPMQSDEDFEELLSQVPV